MCLGHASHKPGYRTSEGISARQICRMLGVARSTIQDNGKRAQVAGLTWPLPEDLTDAVLEGRLFARNGAPRGVRRLAEPVWSALVCELKRPHYPPCGSRQQTAWGDFFNGGVSCDRAGLAGPCRTLQQISLFALCSKK